MKKLWRSLAYNYREGGFGQLFRKLVYRFRQWFWWEEAWLVYRVDLANYRGEVSLPLTYVDLGWEGLCTHEYFKAMAFPEIIRARLKEGKRCRGFFLGGELVNIAWTAHDHLPLEEDGLRLDHGNAAGIFDCWTFPRYRGKGIYPDTLVRMVRLLEQEGAKSVLIAVDPTNQPSIKGIERAGFVPLFRLTRKRRLGRSSLARTNFEPVYHRKAAAV